MTQPNSRPDQELLERLLADEELTAAEMEQLRADPELAARAEGLGEVQSLLDDLGTAAREEMLAERAPGPSPEQIAAMVEDHVGPPKRPSSPWRTLVAAAALIVVAFLVYDRFVADGSEPDDPLIMNGGPDGWKVGDPQLLPDGTLVLEWASPHSDRRGYYDAYLWSVGAAPADDPLLPPALDLEEGKWTISPARVLELPASFELELIRKNRMRNEVDSHRSGPLSLPR